MTSLKIYKEEKQGIWTIIAIFYFSWACTLFGGIFGLIGWICLGITGLAMAKIMLKSIKVKGGKETKWTEEAKS